MALYEADEVSFEVPDGYVDRSMNMFISPSQGPRGQPISVVITRDPRTEETVRDQAIRLLKDVVAALPGGKLLGQRDREVGAQPAREARLQAVQQRVPTYARQTYVGHYGTLLTITVTSPRGAAQQCDAQTERLLGSMRFKKTH
ncbi:DcrB-related protein [Chondromyces apiculatus]|uniref:DUF1795 domain-containing protein n=1 Tax=Chondromyces apiculatus DSM 436 TaxID=1192034 RepID=A0A017T297_9BACT|nr:DcrB-related protein [Chondromyces apiculatus]EYF02666.1 Hypothetical protein CAP_6696 [Chondromyces apiculatus DSM 436]